MTHERAEAELHSCASGVLTINLSALRRNYSVLAEQCKPMPAAAVVKADAYGLGAVAVAGALHSKGCRHFFGAHLKEGLELRGTLPLDAVIYVLNGLLPGEEAACAHAGIVPVINSIAQFERWKEAAQHLQLKCKTVLQFDTGMSRLGIPQTERPTIAEYLESPSNIEVAFLMSHLASADEMHSVQNEDQLAQMKAIGAEFPDHYISFANSSALSLRPDFRFDLIRAGLAMYGGAPEVGDRVALEPVVELEVAVIQTRMIPAGTRVGYGASFVAEKPMRLATISAGYADGLPRTLSNRGAVYYHGVRLPICGRVSMDSITVDASSLSDDALRLGSKVEVLGPHQGICDLARDAQTIPHEILTGLGRRYYRRFC